MVGWRIAIKIENQSKVNQKKKKNVAGRNNKITNIRAEINGTKESEYRENHWNQKLVLGKDQQS